MSLSSLNSIGQTVFELESGNEKCGQTDGRRTHQSNRRVGYTQPKQNKTNERTDLHQFRKEPSYDGDVCPCEV